MTTFRQALRAVVDVGYTILQGQDEGKKAEYERRAYALDVQILLDFGASFPGPESEISPAAARLVDRLVELLYQ